MQAVAVEEKPWIQIHDQTIEVDLTTPRMLRVTARNPFNGLVKEYILKVTHNGLCLA